MSFKAVNYLLFENKNPELDAELLGEFSPYLVTKALTFTNGGALVEYANESLNMYGNVFPSKEETFKFFDNVIIKQKKCKIDFIKKNKIETVADETPIPEFYSKRELDLMNDLSKYLHERTAPSIN